MSSADDLLFAPVGHNTVNVCVPVPWLEVIRKVRIFWNEATIAGGALRDLDNGRPIKDVDIFVPHSDQIKSRLEQVLVMIGLDDLDLIEVPHNQLAGPSKLATQLTNVSHYQFYYEGWRFEITQKLEAFDHRSILDSFDIGLCMITLDGEKIYRSPEYKTDVDNRTMTVVRATGGGETLHARRLQHKYSKYKIIPL